MNETTTERLARVVRDELVRHFQELRPGRPAPRDSCIAAARVTCDALRELGTPAHPMVVRTSYFNRKMVELAGEYGGLGNVPAELLESFRGADASPETPWVVQINDVDDGERAREGRYPGHVVTWAGVLGQLIDPTFDQFARPERGMPAEPSAFRVEDARVRAGEKPGVWTHPNGCVVVIELQPARRDFSWSPDWSDRMRYRRVTARVVEAFRDYDGTPPGDSAGWRR
jgi:hypothetical protein